MELYHYEVLQGQDNWWFAGKRDLIKRWINGRSLDIGCGLDTFCTHGIDIDRETVKLNPKAKWGTAYAIPYKTGYFDTVVCSDVLEHLDKDKKAVKEIYRVLKPGGIAIITVPAHRFLMSEYDLQIGHKRRYSLGMVKKLFSKFKKVKLSYWNFFLSGPITLLLKFKPYYPRFKKLWNPLNSLLTEILRIENFLIEYIDFPFGLTIFGVYMK